ncbi:MAG TPA: sulfur carrier protein ThiS adenylyltransferase ThiF, partial [Candidatus Ozemobacteraceae bacterium]|nr:sulfur carrier protein ThiS adenylyltransferase ThiF [Candidatus Ozemobacteraceae bacterium]
SPGQTGGWWPWPTWTSPSTVRWMICSRSTTCFSCSATPSCARRRQGSCSCRRTRTAPACGGLGSTVALALARVGVGRLVLADFDIVEPTNLNRQQYFIDQLGMPKVEALKATIARVNPAVRVETWGEKLVPGTVASVFVGVDVLVEAFDRADQKAMLVDAAMKAFPDKPIVLGSGMAGWGGNDRLRTRVSGSMTVCGDETSEAVPGRGLMAPRVGIVAHMQANRVMELLLGPDEGLGPKLVTGRFDETC